MNTTDKILVLGSRGLVGSALVRELQKQGHTNILTPVREELDLLDHQAVLRYFEAHRPEYVFMAAAKVGGIMANVTYGADFIFENLQTQQSVFNAAFRFKTPNVLFLGSSCIYPKNAPQPLKEEYLLSSQLEPTNEPYAVAKIAGLKTAQSFRRQYGFNWLAVMPTNLYGINDNYDLQNSHVLPGLIARIKKAVDENAPEFKIWGSGKPRREFLYVDDMARACIFVMKQKGDMPDYLNVGSGEDIAISEVAQMIATKLGYKGRLTYDTTKPDGTMRKVLDVTKLKELGWRPEISLDRGLDIAIEFYLQSQK